MVNNIKEKGNIIASNYNNSKLKGNKRNNNSLTNNNKKILGYSSLGNRLTRDNSSLGSVNLNKTSERNNFRNSKNKFNIFLR